MKDKKLEEKDEARNKVLQDKLDQMAEFLQERVNASEAREKQATEAQTKATEALTKATLAIESLADDKQASIEAYQKAVLALETLVADKQAAVAAAQRSLDSVNRLRGEFLEWFRDLQRRFGEVEETVRSSGSPTNPTNSPEL
jgi:hypothetical protein